MISSERLLKPQIFIAHDIYIFAGTGRTAATTWPWSWSGSITATDRRPEAPPCPPWYQDDPDPSPERRPAPPREMGRWNQLGGGNWVRLWHEELETTVGRDISTIYSINNNFSLHLRTSSCLLLLLILSTFICAQIFYFNQDDCYTVIFFSIIDTFGWI